MLKILGGEFRRRQLGEPPDRVRSRPMPARVKESIFNLLRGWFEDARVLDLFAGIGTVGLEAVSRGAADVVMVERDKEIHSILEWNIRELGCDDRCRAVKADALGPSALAQAPRPVDVAFIDPPYSIMQEDKMVEAVLTQLERLEPVMADKSWLVLRTPKALSEEQRTLACYSGPELHEYGEDMFVYLYFLDRTLTDVEAEETPADS